MYFNQAMLDEDSVMYNHMYTLNSTVSCRVSPYYDKTLDSLNLKNPSVEYPTACCEFDSCVSRDKCLISVSSCHLNKQNSCF